MLREVRVQVASRPTPCRAGFAGSDQTSTAGRAHARHGGWGNLDARHGTSGDARLQHGAQQSVRVGATARHDAVDGTPDDRRGAPPGEDLRVDPASHPEPVDPGDCAGNQLERGLSLAPGGGEVGRGIGTDPLSLKETTGQNALRRLGDVEDRLSPRPQRRP